LAQTSFVFRALQGLNASGKISLERAAITDIGDLDFASARQLFIVGIEARGDSAASLGNTGTIGGYSGLACGHQVVGSHRVWQGDEPCGQQAWRQTKSL